MKLLTALLFMIAVAVAAPTMGKLGMNEYKRRLLI